MELCGDPVSMVTGEEILNLTDITLSGGMPVYWQRLYRSSLIQQNIGLGHGWRSNFHFELSKEPLAEGEGYQWRFIDQQVETYRYDGHLLVQHQRASGFSHYFEWSGAGPSAKCLAQWGDDGTL